MNQLLCPVLQIILIVLCFCNCNQVKSKTISLKLSPMNLLMDVLMFTLNSEKLPWSFCVHLFYFCVTRFKWFNLLLE